MGAIRELDSHVLVEGNVFIGSDLGSDARPEPVAVFTLKERAEDENSNDNDMFSEQTAFE
jgi:hypothetical protein